jgi:hypothetical protein
MILAVAALLFQLPAVAGSSSTPGLAVRPTPTVSPAAITATTSGPASDSGKGPSRMASKSVPEPVAASSSKETSQPLPVHPAGQPANSALDIYLPLPTNFQPEVPPVARPSHAWFVLAMAEHSAAGFDAWSTRQAVEQGRYEADPLMRPFARSSAIYGAIQVLPIGLDYIAHRMQRSSGWSRHFWWIPQSAATATFLFSGSYNALHTR